MAQLEKVVSVTYTEQGRKTMIREKLLNSRITTMAHILFLKPFKSLFGGGTGKDKTEEAGESSVEAVAVILET